MHYGVREGDRVILIDQHREPAKSASRTAAAAKSSTSPRRRRAIEFDVPAATNTRPARTSIACASAYAQHIHRAQGATVTRTLVVTGGWQTSKEPAYVEASRARHGTDWYVARDDLGTEGHDTDRIQRLAEHMRRSRAQTPSLAHHELPNRDYGPRFHHTIAPSRRSRIPGIARAINRLIQPPTQERTR